MALQLIKQVLNANGDEQVISGALIVNESTKETFTAHSDNVAIHTPKATIDAERTTAIATAINLLKDGGDGSTLPADSASLKKIVDALGLIKGTVDTFLSGEPDAGTIDRMSELVAAINTNKDTIDALLTGKSNVSDIVDNLASTDTTKPLSANQGRALKAIIDAVETQVNNTVLDGLGVNATSGNLQFNGVELNGETGLAFVSAVGDTPVYTGKLRMVLTPFVMA